MASLATLYSLADRRQEAQCSKWTVLSFYLFHRLPSRQQEACTGSMLTVSMMPLLSLPDAFPASWDGVTASFMSRAVSAAASRSWLSSGSSFCKPSGAIQHQCPCNAGQAFASACRS